MVITGAGRAKVGWRARNKLAALAAGDHRQRLESPGDAFTLETVIAVLALRKHLHQPLFLESGEMHARGRGTHLADDRQLRARARMPIEQAVEHARSCRLADGSRNAGHTDFDG